MEKEKGEERGRQKKRKTVIFSLVLVWQDQFLFVIMGSGREAVRRLSLRAHTFVWLMVLPPVWYERLKMLACVGFGPSVCGLLYLLKLWLRAFEESSTSWWRQYISSYCVLRGNTLDVTTLHSFFLSLSLSLSLSSLFSFLLWEMPYMDGSHRVCQEYVWAILYINSKKVIVRIYNYYYNWFVIIYW